MMLKLTRHTSTIKAKGFSLIELMIGIALGLFITAIALTYLVSSSQSFRLQNDDSRIQENARFALEILTTNIRLAGFNDDATRTINRFFANAVCPDDSGSGSTTACNGDGIDEGGNSDRLAVEMVTRSAGSGNGCTGFNVGTGRNIANIFWVGNNALNCQTYDIDASAFVGATQPLIDGVDVMQVQYGVDTDADGIVNIYQNYTRVVAGGNTGNILSVRIALLSNSGLNQNTEASVARSYTLLDAVPISITDAQLREIYSTTIKLPNAG